MANYKVAFLVEGFQDLSPSLQIGGECLAYVTEVSEEARQLMEDEVGERLKKLRGPSGLPCIAIGVEAPDERTALKKAWPPARRVADALALLEFEQADAISLAVEKSPRLLANALVANLDDEPPAVRFCYYEPVMAGRFTVGKAVQVARDFNEKVTRHLLTLMPQELLSPDEIQRPIARRLAHSLHWYSQGMNQPELSLHFLALWIALESLAIEDMQTAHKGRKLVGRLSSLVMKHVKAKPDEQGLWDL